MRVANSQSNFLTRKSTKKWNFLKEQKKKVEIFALNWAKRLDFDAGGSKIPPRSQIKNLQNPNFDPLIPKQKNSLPTENGNIKRKGKARPYRKGIEFEIQRIQSRAPLLPIKVH